MLVLVALIALAGAGCTTTLRVSTGAGGQANGHSFSPTADRTGRFVGFESNATNLVAGDTNGHADVFVRDTRDNVTTLASRATDGTIGDGDSSGAQISGNGRFVLFTSSATNFVIGDDNHATDVFVRDRQTGTTRLVSKATDGTVANGTSTGDAISADGTKAVFSSTADDLVTDYSGPQVYLANLRTGTIHRESLPSLCGYRGWYAFTTVAANADASQIAYGIECAPGEFVSPRPTQIELVVRDVANHTNTIAWSFAYTDFGMNSEYVNSASFNTYGDVVFGDFYTNNVHSSRLLAWLWSPFSGEAFQLDLHYHPSQVTSVVQSPDGRYIAFTAPVPDYMSGTPRTRVQLYDYGAVTFYEVSVPIDGPIDNTHPNGDSLNPRFSGDSARIVWDSSANDLVPGDTNGANDVFTRSVADVERGTPETANRVSR
jgi:hypothetical protein